jgi:hypothetical protein
MNLVPRNTSDGGKPFLGFRLHNSTRPRGWFTNLVLNPYTVPFGYAVYSFLRDGVGRRAVQNFDSCDDGRLL